MTPQELIDAFEPCTDDFGQINFNFRGCSGTQQFGTLLPDCFEDRCIAVSVNQGRHVVDAVDSCFTVDIAYAATLAGRSVNGVGWIQHAVA